MGFEPILLVQGQVILFLRAAVYCNHSEHLVWPTGEARKVSTEIQDKTDPGLSPRKDPKQTHNATTIYQLQHGNDRLPHDSHMHHHTHTHTHTRTRTRTHSHRHTQLTVRIWSPNRTPAMAAGEPLATKQTNTPLLTWKRLTPHFPFWSLHSTTSRTPVCVFGMCVCVCVCVCVWCVGVGISMQVVQT